MTGDGHGQSYGNGLGGGCGSGQNFVINLGDGRGTGERISGKTNIGRGDGLSHVPYGILKFHVTLHATELNLQGITINAMLRMQI